ncbi:unnamed protein product [Arctia plantaginis]|uniref:Uncharacterized protein n=1 Tax=Arctia plantaginis TaxID=874455 RepID=A0A8S0ZQN6_ARCPL|nr:unnamed protein product [Arctia plantaginis]
MEKTHSSRRLVTDHNYLIEWCTNICLFAVICAFILYAPLGTPDFYCEKVNQCSCLLEESNLSGQHDRVAACLVCAYYNVLTRLSEIISEYVSFICNLILEMSYDFKLGIYKLLGKIDRSDLCRSAGCEKLQRVEGCRCDNRKADLPVYEYV